MTPFRIAGIAVSSASVTLAPHAAAAHAFGARYDLPLPLGIYLAAAGAAVAVSFIGIFLFLRRSASRSIGLDFVAPQWLAGPFRIGATVLGITILFVVLATGLFGPEDAAQNFSTVFVWVIWWVGFLLLSALVADLWIAVDPFRALFLIVAKLFGRDPEGSYLPLPRQAGWFAPTGILAIGWVELVSDWSESPRSLAALVGLYAVVAISGGVLFGLEWFRTADPLGRLFAALSRMAPLVAAGPNALRLRPPGEGLIDPGPHKAAEVVLIACLIGMVLFDGLSETPAWAATLDFVSESQVLRPALLWLRDNGVNLLKALRTVGLLGTVLLFLAFYWAIAWTMGRFAGRHRSTAFFAAAMAGSLLPIAVAYQLSHYVSYLLLAGQLVGPTASDPFGSGWNLFGLRDATIDVGVVGAEQVWWIAVVALIGGHSLAVLVGHRRALLLFGSAREATRSQIPMLFAMVGLTVLSLWILAQPLVSD